MFKADGVLSADKLLDFQAKLEKLGLLTEASGDHVSASGEWADDSISAESASVDGKLCSPSEERAWMLHQQDPIAAGGPFAMAFRLTGAVNLPALKYAISRLYHGDSNLNYRFALNDKGELIKNHISENGMAVDTVFVNSSVDAINHLLWLQQQPMDLEKYPAIQFTLMPLADREVIVGILGHHILMDDVAWQPVFNAISQYYDPKGYRKLDKRSFPQIQTVDLQAATRYWREEQVGSLHKNDLPLWMMNISQSWAEIDCYDKTNAFNISAAAKRYHVKAKASSLLELANSAQVSLFHGICGLFGIYLTQLLGKPSVNILFPVVARSAVESLSEIEPSSNVLPITIEPLASGIADTLVQVRNRVLQAVAHNIPFEQILTASKASRNSLPNILVTEFVDATKFLTFSDLRVENLPVPPISSDYDLILAFQNQGADSIAFELTTGKAVSASVGAILLEGFIRFIDTHDVRVIPGVAVALSNPIHYENQIPLSGDANLPGANLEDISLLEDFDIDLAGSILTEFRTILSLPTLGLQDDFFEFGGHSLLATRVIGKLKTVYGIQVSIVDFFDAPTAEKLSRHATREQKEVLLDEQQVHQEGQLIPVSLLQAAYLPDSGFGRDTVFNIPFALRFMQAVDETAFHQAFVEVISRHQALRSLFVAGTEAELYQRVIPVAELAEYTWFDYSSNQLELDLDLALRGEAGYSFDLTLELPIRVRFFKDKQGTQVLSIQLYHMSFDEWSAGILIEELFHAYRSYAGGRTPVWNAIPAQYTGFAVDQQRSSILEQQLPYWADYLGKIQQTPPLFQRETGGASSEKQIDLRGSFLEFTLGEKEAAGLALLSANNQCSMFHVIYSAIAIGLYYLGAGKSVLIGTSVSGRADPRYHDTIGFFTNVVMHKTELYDELPIAQVLHQVRDQILAAEPYSEIPFGVVENHVSLQPLQSALDNLCEFYVQFHRKNALNDRLPMDDGSFVNFQLLEPPRETSKFGLHFEVYEEPLPVGSIIRGVINYRCQHYQDWQAKLIQTTIQLLLQRLAEGRCVTLRDLRKHLKNINVEASGTI